MHTHQGFSYPVEGPWQPAAKSMVNKVLALRCLRLRIQIRRSSPHIVHNVLGVTASKVVHQSLQRPTSELRKTVVNDFGAFHLHATLLRTYFESAVAICVSP